MQDSQPGNGSAIEEIDRTRGDQYRFLASLLASAPSQDMLRGISALAGDATAFGSAITSVARAAGNATPAGVEREFFELFVGVGRGELLPYASFYRDRYSVNERPLAEVRADLAQVGYSPAPTTRFDA